MKNGRRALALPLLALPLLWGCSASPPAESQYVDSKAGSEGTRARRGYTPAPETTRDLDRAEGSEQVADGLPEPAPLEADPHHKRPGARGAHRPAPLVTFLPPSTPLTPVLPSRRPRMDVPVHLCLAFVRDGRVVDDSKTFLELEGRLRRESKIRAIVGLTRPRKTSVVLDDLVAQAKAEGRGLLLVDVLPPSEGGARRIGYLYHTDEGGVLMAKYELHSDGGDAIPASSGGSAMSLCDRVGLAYARLSD